MNFNKKINFWTARLLLILLAAVFLPVAGYCQENEKTSSEKNDSLYGYHLTIPAGWGVERFPLPPEFAPSITYKGAEDLRFAPGWADVKSEEHWSYAFLWWLEGSPEINAGILQADLQAYYTGLIAINSKGRNIPADKIIPAAAIIKKATTASGDLATYSGIINLLDYYTVQPMTLNCVIHVKSCRDKNHAAIFFELSPKPFTHPVWKKLNEIGEHFDCSK